MTEKAAAPVPKNPWPDRLKRMKEHQGNHSKNWTRNEKLLFGEIAAASGATETPNAVAYGYACAKALKGQIYVRNPDTIVDARAPQWSESAALLTGAVNYDFAQMDVKTLGNLLIDDCHVYGYGAIMETIETESKTGTIRFPGGDEGEATIPTEQNYVCRRILPRDILFDPKGLLLDLSDHAYIASAWYPTVSELRADPFFSLPSDIDKYTACTALSRQKSGVQSPATGFDGLSGTVEETDPDYKTICVWEIWDKTSGEVLYMTDDHERLIGKREKWPFELQFGGRKLFPVTLMAFNPVPTGFYPKPSIDLVAPQLTAINTLERQLITDLTTKWRKYAAFAKFISPEQAGAFTDPNTANSLMLIDNDSFDELAAGQHGHEVDIRRLLTKMEDVSPPADTPMGLAHLKQEVEEILGYGPTDRVGHPSTRSAREAVLINDRQSKGLSSLEDAIAEFYRLLGTKHIQILQQTMVLPRYARIDSEFAKLSLWKQYAQGDVAGDFEFVVYPGTGGPKTSEAKQASEMQLFQAVAPILQAIGADLRPAFYRLARYMSWDDVDSLFRGTKQAMENLAVTLVKAQQGAVTGPQFLEAASQAVLAYLTPEQFAMLQQQLKQQMSGGGAASQGSAPAPTGMRGDANPLATSAGVS